jgi:IS605 OrfB family transposase
MSDALIRTVPVKLDVHGHSSLLSDTAVAFNAAATWIAGVCWDEGITNNTTAHHRVYGETRRHFGLGARLAVCARAKAMEAIKSARATDEDRCPEFGPRGSVRYDARTYRLLARDRVSLNTLHGRVVCRMLLGARQHTMLVDPEWEIGGVDLGIVNIATDSTGQTFTGTPVRLVREKRVRQRRRLQTRNTRRSRAKLRKTACREARFQRDINHIVSKALVARAKGACNALALEDLTGINARTRVRHADRQQRMSWAFSQLRQFVAYKAQAAGVRVVLVNPCDTSRTCSRPACGFCHERNRPDQAHFRCLQCGFTLPADWHAARTIAARAAVNQPIVLPPLAFERGLCPPATAIASTSPPAVAVGR